MTNATDALRQMLRLFDEQGNVTADPAKLQAAINDGYLTLSALSQLTASPDREKVALQARLKNVLGVMKGARLRCEPMAVWADDVKAIEDAIDTITPDEAAIRAAAFEEAAKIVTSRVEGMELQRFVCNGATCTDTRGNDLFIAKSDVERLLTDRAAAIRSQEAGR